MSKQKQSAKKAANHTIDKLKNSENFDRLKDYSVEILGNENISIEGCLGVSEYHSDYVCLKVKKGLITVCGDGFDITRFENRSITVKGKISSVEFNTHS